MSYMFVRANSFNQTLNKWDTSNVTNMEGMFWGADAFNQNINSWDTSKVSNMDYMFEFSPLQNNPPKWYKGILFIKI